LGGPQESNEEDSVPELPEVETVVRQLAPCIEGRTVRRATLRARDLYRSGSLSLASVRASRVEGVERAGKAIVIRLGGGLPGVEMLVVHLGMTGRVVVPGATGGGMPVMEPAVAGSLPPFAGVAYGGRHRHGRIVFVGGPELWYVDPRRFGYLFVGPADGLRDRLHIGPDPFELTARAMSARLRGRKAPIKSLLLNQRVISGIGNIYADEILYHAGMHPLRSGASVERDTGILLRRARTVLRRAIQHRGTTLRDYRTPDGRRGSFQSCLLVYAREGERCRRCGARIRKIVVAGRGTHFCPGCQRAPRRARAR